MTAEALAELIALMQEWIAAELYVIGETTRDFVTDCSRLVAKVEERCDILGLSPLVANDLIPEYVRDTIDMADES